MGPHYTCVAVRVEIEHYSVAYFDHVSAVRSKCCSTVLPLRAGPIRSM